ncbi:MAG: right-handed parallel beta-helix repeat-containing protein, partial [Planctomycetota bacterium]
GYWGHLWAGSMVRIAELDTRNRRITTEQGTGYGFREGYPYYYFNLFEEIDSPGEWYLDRKTGTLYIYPPKDARGAIVQFPVLDRPFVSMNDVSHVAVLGLTFELNRADAFVIDGGEHVLLGGCTLRQLGGNGVVVRGGKSHLVLGCDILTVGAGGLRVAGGDPKTLTPGGHVVENCRVYDFSRVDRVYAPAVHLDGVGNRIAHNLFHESPHHAMRVEGYDQTIEFNEVHSVVWESDDQAGIDIYGNAAYRGNVIRYNFWHHIGSGRNVAGQAGIRLDDFISGTLMYGNVFYRAADGRFGGIQIHGGKDNIADNNLFVDCRAAFSFSPWGETRWKTSLKERGGPSGTVWRGIDVSRPPHAERWPELLHLEENPDRNFLLRNVAVNCGRFALRERGVNEIFDAFLFDDTITFTGKDALDFTLPDDSPIYDRLGFRPIPFN